MQPQHRASGKGTALDSCLLGLPSAYYSGLVSQCYSQTTGKVLLWTFCTHCWSLEDLKTELDQISHLRMTVTVGQCGKSEAGAHFSYSALYTK